MIKMTKEGKAWLDGMYGDKGLHDLHIRADGGKCSWNCPRCKCCKGQITIVDEPAGAGDTYIEEQGYKFSVDAEMIKKAKMLFLDASGAVPSLTCTRPIW